MCFMSICLLPMCLFIVIVYCINFIFYTMSMEEIKNTHLCNYPDHLTHNINKLLIAQ